MRDPFTHRRTRRSSKSNPYVERSFEFPGRIFVFENPAEDIAAVRRLTLDRPVFCELGSGSGMHLIERAALKARAQFFGFELRYKRSVRTLEKAVERKIENLFVLRVDAGAVGQVFAPGSLQGVYVNFPDPWDKHKKTKKRMLSAQQLAVLRELLVPGGFVAFKTDHEQYYEWVLAEAGASGVFDIAWRSRDLHSSEYREQNVETEFEKLFLSQGLPIYAAELRARELAES